MSAPVFIPPGPFGEGYEDGLFGRPVNLGFYATERARAKYCDGYAIGAQERGAGALEPDVDAS